MAAAVFIDVNDTEFTLNGISYYKVFMALPHGNNAITVVGVYEGRNVILKNTPVGDITVDGTTYGSLAPLIDALKPVLYNYGEAGGGGGTTQPYLGKKSYSLNLSGITITDDELEYVAAAINRGNGTNPVTAPAFTCASGQEMIFETRTVQGSDQNDYKIIVRKYSLYSMLTSVGGAGAGSFITKNDIYNDGYQIIQVGSSNNDELVIHYGEIGTTPIEDKVNEGDENGEAWNIEGFRVFDCLRSGELFVYIFIGPPGLYGGDDLGSDPNILEALPEHFQDITDQPIVNPTGMFTNTYDDIAEMLSEQAEQNTLNRILVQDASDDPNITFASGETKLQAEYRFNGTATGSINDYTLISVPYGNHISLNGYNETGSREYGDLIVKVGDYDDSGNGNKITIDDAGDEIEIKAGGFKVVSPSFTFSKYDGNGHIVTTESDAPGKTAKIPNKSGTFAMLDDLLPVINVKAFGAKGDGATDDSDAILDAISASKNGDIKKVYFPKGVYLISHTLKIPSNVEIFGDGKNISIIKNSPTADATLDIIQILNAVTPDTFQYKTMIATEGADWNDATSSENVRINNIGVDWSGTDSGVNSIMPMLIGRATNCIIDNIKLFDAYQDNRRQGSSILFALAEDCEISNSWIGASDYESVSVQYLSKRITIKYNVFDIFKDTATTLYQVHAAQIARPTPMITALTAEFGDAISRDCFVFGNTFLLRKNVGHAFTSHASEGIYFKDNYVKFYSGNVAWGVKPFEASKNIEIVNNIFDALDGGMNDYLADAATTNNVAQKLGFCAIAVNSGNLIDAEFEPIENVLIAGNSVYIKNTALATNAAPPKPSAILGGYHNKGNNVIISNNIIDIDGYDDNNVPIIATNGDNVQVHGNIVRLANPLETQTSAGFIGYKTVAGDLINVNNNSFDGILAYGTFIEDIGEAVTNISIQKNLSNGAISEYYSEFPNILESNTIYTKKITLTPAEIIAITSTRIDAIPAPGAGKFIEVVSVSSFLDYNSVAYDGQFLFITFDGASGRVCQMRTNVLTSTSDNFTSWFPAQTSASVIVPNAKVQISGFGESTVGNSPVTIWITFKINRL